MYTTTKQNFNISSFLKYIQRIHDSWVSFLWRLHVIYAQ